MCRTERSKLTDSCPKDIGLLLTLTRYYMYVLIGRIKMLACFVTKVARNETDKWQCDIKLVVTVVVGFSACFSDVRHREIHLIRYESCIATRRVVYETHPLNHSLILVVNVIVFFTARRYMVVGSIFLTWPNPTHKWSEPYNPTQNYHETLDPSQPDPFMHDL